MTNENAGGSPKETASRIAARAIAQAAASSARETGSSTGAKNPTPMRKSRSRRAKDPTEIDWNLWHDFTQRLSLALHALDEEEFLIVSIRGTNLYVQFSEQGLLGMRAEATSSYYLPEHETLDDRQHAALLRLGWRAPTNLPEGIGPHETEGSPNYFVEIEPPVEHDRLAVQAVATLALVFGATGPDRLEYQAFVEDGTQILFPELGIAEAER